MAEETRSEKGLLGKHKWRGKLFSAEGKFGRSSSLESTESDIANFLQGATPRPEARSQLIDIASGPGTTVDTRLPSVRSVRPKIVDIYRRPKSRQNKGLHVSFTSAPPDIIGEGGDEAELPANEVSKLYQYSVGRDGLKGPETASASDNEPSREGQRRPSGSEGEGFFRRTTLQRIPTGLEDVQLDERRDDEYQNADRAESDCSISPKESYKTLPQPPVTRYEQDGHHDSKAIRRKELPRDMPLISDQAVDYDDSTRARMGISSSHSLAPALDVPTPDTLASNSVTPRSSPQPPSHIRKGSSSSYTFPSTESCSKSPPQPADPPRQTRLQASATGESKPLSLRNVARGLGDDSLDDFGGRVRRFNDIFRLGVSARRDMKKVPFVQWIRTATWWFLKGRTALESVVRSRSLGSEGASPEPYSDPGIAVKQAYINLAKSLWIVREITPQHPEVMRFGNSGMSSLIAIINIFGDQALAELVGVHLSVISNMRALTMSMKRNGILPPYELEIQGLDLPVLLDLPALSTEVAKHLINNIPGATVRAGWSVSRPFFPILVGDTGRHFSFGRMFVEASLHSGSDTEEYMHMPCVVSILRERNEWGVEAVVASQDGQVNLVIQSSGQGALTWKSVHWKVPSHMMQVSLSGDFELRLQFLEKDFRTLWGIYDYTRRVQKAYSPSRDEDIIFERELDNFQCDDRLNFPPDPIPGCRLRLFEKRPTISDGTSRRRIHEGYRLTVVTPPGTKTLSSVDHKLGKEQPILFSYQQSTQGPRLVLRIPPYIRLSPSFHDTQDRELFRSLLCGTSIAQEDYAYDPLPLRSLDIVNTSADQDSTFSDDVPTFKTLQWNKLRIINRGRPPYGHHTFPTVHAEHFRVIIESEFAMLVDRINLDPGELQIGLSVDELNKIKLLRSPQLDMTLSMIEGESSKEESQAVGRMLQKISTSATIRTYHFRSKADLHNFQTVITRFKVLFDGSASNFAISHRRSVLPIHKQREANSVRLQIIKQDKVVQLVAFFEDFGHGNCMNFVLKGTDIFETFSRSGKFYLCMMDAKFALPKGEEDTTRDFVCLESPEYPGEHDDITIGFDSEQDRDRFGETLPAPVNKMSRIASLRR
ncbi:hypothetical protein N7G274_005184 [Stereocaulon virgatum]|uniref:Uncharacterized protein n=1 Tax=Stereocaulon virgatum TaxID=373712 RepID=A0ABR4A9B6_9LECA